MKGRPGGIRYTVRLLAVGSWTIVSRTWSRLWAAGREEGDRIGPVLLVVIGGGMVGMTVTSTPILASPLTLAWLVCAYIAGRRVTEGGDPQEIRTDGEGAEQLGRPPTDHELILVVSHLIATRNGVLLRDVVAHLHRHGVPASWDIPELRTQCSRLGIQIKESIKVGKSTSPGIHRRAVKAVLPALANAPATAPAEASPAPLSEEQAVHD